MKVTGRHLLISSQLLVVFAFFAGMIMNFYLLRPFIDAGEGARLTVELDDFCSNFYLWGECDVRDKKQRDSVLAAVKRPYDGDLFIMEVDGEIIYARDSESGNGFEAIAAKYGEIATRLLEAEYGRPTGRSIMDYDFKNNLSMYASFEKDYGLMFFYVLDYGIAGHELMRTFYNLLMYMVIVGVLIMLISFFVVRKIDRQTHSARMVQHDLDTASKIQKAMLPRGERHLMQIDVNARLIPAKKVGGDFYHYILNDGLLYFCIGDVSGKGVPASLFMGKAATLFRSYANEGMEISSLAGRLNKELCVNNDQNMFMTGIIGTMRAYDGYIRYVNAGHEAPVIWDGKPGSSLSFLQSKGSIPFGLMDDAEFAEESFTMEKDGMVLLYTDGISEAKNKKKEYLGRERLLSILEPFKTSSSKDINDSLLKYISGYETGEEQSDDITLLTFRNSASPKHFKIKNEIPELKKLSFFVEEVLKECGIPQNEHILVRSGLDEALTNCVLYAYDSPGKVIEVTASVEDRKLCFTVKDGGKPFNPLEYESAPREELKVGGLGISMYKANFDDVEYSREGDSNILKLIKQL